MDRTGLCPPCIAIAFDVVVAVAEYVAERRVAMALIGFGLDVLEMQSLADGEPKVGGSACDTAKKAAGATPKLGSAGGPGAGKRYIPKSVKNAEHDRTGGTCVFCGKQTSNKPGSNQLNYDHSTSVKNNGNNSLDNIQTTCRTCNLQKNWRNTEKFLKDLSNGEKLKALEP